MKKCIGEGLLQNHELKVFFEKSKLFKELCKSSKEVTYVIRKVNVSKNVVRWIIRLYEE